MTSPINILIAAQKKKIVEERFIIPIEGSEGIAAVLTLEDMYGIQERQDIIYREKFCEYRERGLDKQPIDEKEWENDLMQLKKKTREIMEKEKPENMAQQGAGRFSNLRTIQELVPQFLRDEKGVLLFPTVEAQKTFEKMIKQDMALMKLVTEAYVNLIKKKAEVSDQAKNSSKIAESGN